MENLEGILSQSLPLLLFVFLEVHSDLFDVSEDLLDSSVSVAVLWFSVVSKDMVNSIGHRTIFEEVPVIWRSDGIHESPLLVVNLGLLFKDITVLSHQLLGVGDSHLVVILDEGLDLIWFHSFEAFKEDVVLDIL